MSQPLLFVLMALAAYRLWRIIGEDEWPPSRALRAYVARRAEHGNLIERLRPARAWAEVQTMIECPWCLGTWISIAVVIVCAQLTSVELPILQAMGVACAVGLIGSSLDG